jgi:glutathione S-transferase
LGRLKIYHGKHTRSLRVVWIAEELGVPFEIKHTPFNPATLKSDEYLSINPFGALPAIEDGGVRMTESGAICQYLTEKYGHSPFKRVLGDPDYPRYLQWIHAGEATMTPPLGAIAQHTVVRPPEKRLSMVAAEAAETLRSRLAVLDMHLGETGFLLGEHMSAADVMVGYALHLADLLGMLKDAPDDVAKYWARLKERPAYQRAIAA